LGILVGLADIDEERLVEDVNRGTGLDLDDVVFGLVQHVPEARHPPHLFLGAPESSNATSAISFSEPSPRSRILLQLGRRPRVQGSGSVSVRGVELVTSSASGA